MPILGIPMVGHCFHRTRLALGGESTFVATCDREIADYTKELGGRAVMTSADHTRATSRVAEAVEVLEVEGGQPADLIVMVQGDEPLILPDTIQRALTLFEDPEVAIVNVVYASDALEVVADPNNVKVVVDRRKDALYFSRAPIPLSWGQQPDAPALVQTGVIVFRREQLVRFDELEESDLERIESIDMNRVLEHGGKVRTVLCEQPMIGVDTPHELQLAAECLREDPIHRLYSGS